MVNRNIQDLTAATAYDRNGDKLGSVKQVYVNDSTGQPDFVEVGHGLFGMSSSLVPLRGHQLTGEELRLAFTKDRIKDAPDIEDDAHLSDEDQAVISEERVNVSKETVPVEEVSLHKETVRDTETVRGDVAREEIDVDTGDGTEGDPTLRR